MRVAFRVGVAAMALAGGGCRQSEEDVLVELRRQFLDQCVAGAEAKGGAANAASFCACTTDRLLNGRSAADIQQLMKDGDRMRAAARDAGVACGTTEVPDLPPLQLDAPRAPASQNKQKGEERPRRAEPAGRPKAEPAPRRSSADGPIATPRPMPVPPAQNRAAPPPPPGFGSPPPPPPRANAQAPRMGGQRP